MVHFEWVPQFQTRIDPVMIATAFLGDLEVPRLGQFRNNPLHHPLGNTNRQGDIPQSFVGIAEQAQEHMRVIGQKRPAGGRRDRDWSDWANSFLHG